MRRCSRSQIDQFDHPGPVQATGPSKATAHLEAVRQLRKKADQKKASLARQNERQKLWEKRHLNRDIRKKQCRKNNAKIDAKKEAKRLKEDAEAKAKAEKEAKEKAEQEAKERAEKEAAEKAQAVSTGVQTDAESAAPAEADKKDTKSVPVSRSQRAV